VPATEMSLYWNAMSVTAPPKLPQGLGLRVTEDLAVGAVLGGKYRVESVVGRGGMAVVFAAKHLTLGHGVAIKVLRSDVGDPPELAARIVREARAAAGLTSENVTRVLDIGTLDSGEPYIVMERLEGADLGRTLAERGALPLCETASYLVQACEGVAEAHAKNIVHRDLKPSNLFLTKRRDGSSLVKLMDFGISKVISDAPDEALTTTQDCLGTPHYMSPEQLLRSRDVDTRTDVWALGVILYQMLTGERPFSGATTPAVHVAVAAAKAPRLRNKLPDAPPEVEALILECLVKSPARRLQTVQALAKALLPFADEATQVRHAHFRTDEPAPPESSDPEPQAGLDDLVASPEAETRTAPGMARSSGSVKLRRDVWTWGGAIALAIAAGGVFVALGSRQQPPAASSTVAAPGVSTAPAASPDPASSTPPVTTPAEVATPSPSASASTARARPVRRPSRPVAPSLPTEPTPAKAGPYSERQ
jgi:eukaryotic-like serine/threonine-protein kinase